MTGPGRVVVRVSRRFTAAPERVFDAWLDPRMIRRWMFGARLRDEEILRVAIDARVGGTFSFLVRREGVELDHVGTYREVDRPRRLVFTWGVGAESGDDSVVTVEIAPLAAGCELTLTHVMDAKWAEYAARTEAGWTRMLDVMAETV